MVAAHLVPLLPLGGAAALLLFRRPLSRFAGYLATGTVAGSFGAALVLLGELISRAEERGAAVVVAYDWISVAGLDVVLSWRVDPLSVVMILVVTGVGSIIHYYSIGYMANDPRRDTYFAYLNLFVFSMLVLVLATNFLVLYVGWELVGLCSYLLISFWRHKPAAAAAGKKAFIVNRIGDLGFLIGILLILGTFGTLDFDRVFGAASSGALPAGLAAAIPLLLFIGACGKSAQIPLHVWLPDAMEGPTPVSALIHAATMVTAGVYVVARAHVLFEASNVAGMTVAVIGTVTALFAATIALAQDDIKRVLAYSTISQLGYMFLAVGIGALTGSAIAYGAAIFHLVTHAFFKALLFLGAGSVMHATGDETDMKKMGGLLRALPVTGTTFMVGWLAISGIPPLSGFFSKDAILAVTWEAGRPMLWLTALVTALLTAFYLSRQVFLIFFGPSRLSSTEQPHESPPVMTMPLRILAILAAGGGLLGLTLGGGLLFRFLSPVFGEGHGAGLEPPVHIAEPLLALIAVAAAVAGILAAFRFYLAPGSEEARTRAKRALGPLVTLVRNKYYVDEVYGAVLVWPSKTLTNLVAYGFDVKVIDGAVNGVAKVVVASASRLRRVQTGQVRRYVMAMLAGALVILTLLVVRVR